MRIPFVIRIILISFLTLPVLACQGQEGTPDAAALQIQDDSFGLLIQELSGKPGYFDTDNLISNESSYLHVIPQLNALQIEGGAYLGVGPDQNFSYIAHIQPEIAFIVDIRRDNMLMHLMYKAIFELSESRLDFLAYLFAKDISGQDEKSGSWDINQIMSTIEEAQTSESHTKETVRAIEKRVRAFGVDLSDKDLATIKRFHNEFIRLGPGLRFTSHNRSPRAYYPTYKQLMSEQDIKGNHASYLSSESLFQVLKDLHEADKIIPVVGNFADPEAIPAIGQFLKEKNLKLSSFYTSNVEYYLMYQGNYPAFLRNLSQLPLSENSVIIRSYFNRFRSTHPLTVPGYASTQLLQSMESLLANPEATYSDLIFEYYIPR